MTAFSGSVSLLGRLTELRETLMTKDTAKDAEGEMCRVRCVGGVQRFMPSSRAHASGTSVCSAPRVLGTQSFYLFMEASSCHCD